MQIEVNAYNFVWSLGVKTKTVFLRFSGILNYINQTRPEQ